MGLYSKLGEVLCAGSRVMVDTGWFAAVVGRLGSSHVGLHEIANEDPIDFRWLDRPPETSEQIIQMYRLGSSSHVA
ncbi:hypothetical protein GOBAR_AA10973 [Gossypium barbadense]|nr:hypothetical protein GOBAR_AA10973 [Gossypium barbadense]